MAEFATVTTIGPESNGMRMSLEEFARVRGRPGYIYELEKGVIVTADVPGLAHMFVKMAIRDALVIYRLANPSRVILIADGGDTALRMPGMESERHPDLSVYLTAPPPGEDQPWEEWTPDLVIEVVSESSVERDYHIKRDEYIKAGVRAYWIFNPMERTATALTRRGDRWQPQTLAESQTLTTRLLPGFELKLADVFAVIPRTGH